MNCKCGHSVEYHHNAATAYPCSECYCIDFRPVREECLTEKAAKSARKGEAVMVSCTCSRCTPFRMRRE